MSIARKTLFATLGIAAIAFYAESGRLPAEASPAIVAQASTPPAALSGTPEPTEEPTTPPSDAIVAAAAVGPEWGAFAKIVETADDFISTIQSKENVEGKEASGTRKPTYARCEIVAGEGVGGVAIWRGGNKVQAHEGGEHKDIIVVLPQHNKHVTDLLGFGCGDTTPDRIVGYTTHNGKLTEAAGPTINGEATDDVTWIPNAGDMVKLTKTDFFISKVSHLLVASKSYVGDALVADAQWTIQVNPGVPFSTFDIGS
jgi:hypothetical protein